MDYRDQIREFVPQTDQEVNDKRIILELKDKMGGAAELDFSAGPAAAAPAQSGGIALAQAALQELGYSPAEIAAALKGADPDASTEELVRYALRAMVMKG